MCCCVQAARRNSGDAGNGTGTTYKRVNDMSSQRVAKRGNDMSSQRVAQCPGEVKRSAANVIKVIPTSSATTRPSLRFGASVVFKVEQSSLE